MISRRRFLGGAFSAAASFTLAGRSAALEEGQPSRTALSTALQRAAHQLLESPRVFDDPVALSVLGARRVAWLGRNLERYRSAQSRAWRAFLVMRSRFAEDELARSVREGARQYVVLGAGLDTFAYRNPHRRLRVFEVDHPSTQAWKRARLADSGIELPASLRIAPVDFERQALRDGLRMAGFRADAPAFLSWLGVTIYLTRPAVMDTLGFVAKRCAKGSRIVFDFGLPDEAIDDAERKSRAESAARVAAAGEPWITYFDPAELSAGMRAMGFRETRVLATEEANDLYFKGRTDGFRLYGSGRLMCAAV